jgi:hypothetical protein
VLAGTNALHDRRIVHNGLLGRGYLTHDRISKTKAGKPGNSDLDAPSVRLT